MNSYKWKNIFTIILSDKVSIKNNIIIFNILDLIKYNVQFDTITLPIYYINNYLYFPLNLLKYIQNNNINNYLYDSTILNFYNEYNTDILHFFENGCLITYIPLNQHLYNYINLININDKLNYITTHFNYNRTEIYTLYNSINAHIICKENLDDKIEKLENKISNLEKEVLELKK